MINVKFWEEEWLADYILEHGLIEPTKFLHMDISREEMIELVQKDIDDKDED
jgi:hypothetical protein